MNLQLIFTIILGLGACLYVLKKISRQFHQSHTDLLCEECDVVKKREIDE